MPGLRLRLEAFLAVRGVQARVTDIVRMAGGFSQDTYKFTVDDAGYVRTFVLRMDRPMGESFSVTDRVVEAHVIAALNESGAPVPILRWADLDGCELGSRALVSDLANGRNMLDVVRSANSRRHMELALTATEVAAAVHKVDATRFAECLEFPADGNAYLDSQIQGWRQLETAHGEPMPAVRYLSAWLEAHRPSPVDLTLVHGDFSLSIMIIDGTQVAVIDWEYAHLGDPRVDLGWCIQRGAKEPPNILFDNLDVVCRRYRDLTGMSDEAVNPDTVLYFAVLRSWRPFRAILLRISAVASGENSHLLAAYLASAWVKACHEWLDITAHIDGRTASSVPRLLR